MRLNLVIALGELGRCFKASLGSSGSNRPQRLRALAITASILANVSASGAPAGPPERLLLENTLAFLATSDFRELRRAWEASPHGRCFNDPAWKPFCDNFLGSIGGGLIKQVETSLMAKWEDFDPLLKGEVLLALIQPPAAGPGEPKAEFLVVANSLDQSSRLQSRLAALRKKWRDCGTLIRKETIQGFEFDLCRWDSSLPTNSSSSGPAQLPGGLASHYLAIGQVGSLLLAGTSVHQLEQVMVRLSISSQNGLVNNVDYQRSQTAGLSTASIYGWINLKLLLNDRGGPSRNAAHLSLERGAIRNTILRAAGLMNLDSLGLSWRFGPDGSLFQAVLSVPENQRQGLLGVLGGSSSQQVIPPAFVPADAVSCMRWRLDAQKTWAAMQKVLCDVSPQLTNAVNFVLDSANAYAKQKDPEFDIRRDLLGNLGGDILTYRKKSGTNALPARTASPALVLIGSEHAEKLARSLEAVLVFVSLNASEPPKEREFLGTKVFSVGIANSAVQAFGATPGNSPLTLHYSASGGYLALSLDAGMVEEFLRFCQTPGTSLADLPGFKDAGQKVTAGATLFGYSNQAEQLRLAMKGQPPRRDAAATAADTLFPGASWLVRSSIASADPSLLPSLQELSRFSYFSFYSVAGTPDGLVLRSFAPRPPGLN